MPEASSNPSAPFKEKEAELFFNRGFDPCGELFNLALAAGFIKQSGSWFSVADERLGQGKSKALESLKKNPPLLVDLSKRLSLATLWQEAFAVTLH